MIRKVQLWRILCCTYAIDIPRSITHKFTECSNITSSLSTNFWIQTPRYLVSVWPKSRKRSSFTKGNSFYEKRSNILVEHKHPPTNHQPHRTVRKLSLNLRWIEFYLSSACKSILSLSLVRPSFRVTTGSLPPSPSSSVYSANPFVTVQPSKIQSPLSPSLSDVFYVPSRHNRRRRRCCLVSADVRKDD